MLKTGGELWAGWNSHDQADILREYPFDRTTLAHHLQQRRRRCAAVCSPLCGSQHLTREGAEVKAGRYHCAVTPTMLLYYIDKKRMRCHRVPLSHISSVEVKQENGSTDNAALLTVTLRSGSSAQLTIPCLQEPHLVRGDILRLRSGDITAPAAVKAAQEAARAATVMHPATELLLRGGVGEVVGALRGASEREQRRATLGAPFTSGRQLAVASSSIVPEVGNPSEPIVNRRHTLGPAPTRSPASATNPASFTEKLAGSYSRLRPGTQDLPRSHSEKPHPRPMPQLVNSQVTASPLPRQIGIGPEVQATAVDARHTSLAVQGTPSHTHVQVNNKSGFPAATQAAATNLPAAALVGQNRAKEVILHIQVDPETGGLGRDEAVSGMGARLLSSNLGVSPSEKATLLQLVEHALSLSATAAADLSTASGTWHTLLPLVHDTEHSLSALLSTL